MNVLLSILHVYCMEAYHISQYRKTLKLHTLDMMRLWVYFTEGQRCFNSNNL